MSLIDPRHRTAAAARLEERHRCEMLLREELGWWGYDSDNVSNWPTAFIVERLENLLEHIEHGETAKK
jgi:hypothetical protein